MSQRKHSDVKIINSASGRGYTSRKNAVRYVNRGTAVWTRDATGRLAIEFLSGDPRIAQVMASAARSVDQAGYDTATGKGFAVPKYVYREEMEYQPFAMKRHFPGGGFVRWTKKDKFSPVRFNQDRIPAPLIAFDYEQSIT